MEKVFLKITKLFIMRNLTDFRKTVETSVDPPNVLWFWLVKKAVLYCSVLEGFRSEHLVSLQIA